MRSSDCAVSALVLLSRPRRRKVPALPVTPKLSGVAVRRYAPTWRGREGPAHPCAPSQVPTTPPDVRSTELRPRERGRRKKNQGTNRSGAVAQIESKQKSKRNQQKSKEKNGESTRSRTSWRESLAVSSAEREAGERDTHREERIWRGRSSASSSSPRVACYRRCSSSPPLIHRCRKVEEEPTAGSTGARGGRVRRLRYVHGCGR